jgi:hypothetical protein
MTPQTREGDVLAAVTSLVDQLLQSFDLVDLLTDLTQRCVQLLDVESSGLLLSDARGQLNLMTATSTATTDLELFQLQIEEGPCLDCFSTGAPVSVSDLHAESDHWPRFVPAATGLGYASVHAVPMRAAGIVIGAIGLFGTSTGHLSESDMTVGTALAHVATVAIIQERAPSPETVIPGLRSALASRVVVEQAKGLLHNRLGTSFDESFRILRSHAHAHDRRLTDLARELVADRQARSMLLEAIAHERAMS